MIGRALLRVIGFYSRAVSPALPARCRFYPTCSAYAAEAISVHGAGRGSWLAMRRLVKCAPWHPGGVDLVPAPRRTGGTVDAVRSSSSTTAPATPPASSPATQEESSVA